MCINPWCLISVNEHANNNGLTPTNYYCYSQQLLCMRHCLPLASFFIYAISFHSFYALMQLTWLLFLILFLIRIFISILLQFPYQCLSVRSLYWSFWSFCALVIHFSDIFSFICCLFATFFSSPLAISNFVLPHLEFFSFLLPYPHTPRS